MESISLALSGGGSRCIFSLGVIKYLEEKNIKISAISGSSGGAIIGSLIATGKSSEEVLALLESINYKKLVKFNYFKNGFFHLEKARDSFNNLIEVKELENLKIKMFITTIDLAKGEIVYFDRGNIASLVMASSSLFPIFKPFEYEGRLYIDGGFMNNLPIEPLKNLNEKILAINVNPLIELKRSRWKFSQTLKRSLYLMFNANMQVRVKEADFYLEPKAIGKFSIFDTNCFGECFEIGYKFAKENLKV